MEDSWAMVCPLRESLWPRDLSCWHMCITWGLVGVVGCVVVILLVHVARIMRVNRIIRTRMVHVVVSIVSCASGRGISQFWFLFT